MESKNISIVRWFARITGALLLILIAIFIIGEGFPNPMTLSQDELLLFIAVSTMEIGVILAFKWELPGCLLIIGGYVFFVIVERNILPGPVFPIFFLVGILYLFCWWKSSKCSKLPPTKNKHH